VVGLCLSELHDRALFLACALVDSALHALSRLLRESEGDDGRWLNPFVDDEVDYSPSEGLRLSGSSTSNDSDVPRSR